MNISPSVGNALSGIQAKASIKPESVKNEVKASPNTTEVKAVESQKSVVSNQVANPDSKGVDLTV